MKDNIDKVILNPELATYDNYKWIATLYKNNNSKKDIEKYINKEYISKIYYKFYFRLSEEDIYNKYSYYSFLYDKNIRYLLALKNSSKFDYYINKLIILKI